MKRPRLKLETGTPAERRTLLLPEARSSREVMSACSVEEEDLPREAGAYRSVERAAKDRLDLIEESCRKMLAIADEHDVKARTARGMHIKRAKDWANGAREWAEESRHSVKPLPHAKNKEPFTIYAYAPTEYADTLQISGFDGAGFQVLSMRVTGSTVVRASAIEHAWELADNMKRSAADPKLMLVRG